MLWAFTNVSLAVEQGMKPQLNAYLGFVIKFIMSDCVLFQKQFFCSNQMEWMTYRPCA